MLKGTVCGKSLWTVKDVKIFMNTKYNCSKNTRRKLEVKVSLIYFKI